MEFSRRPVRGLFRSASYTGTPYGYQRHPTLGELERVSMVEDRLTLEGDFGDIVIQKAKVSVEKVA